MGHVSLPPEDGVGLAPQVGPGRGLGRGERCFPAHPAPSRNWGLPRNLSPGPGRGPVPYPPSARAEAGSS